MVNAKRRNGELAKTDVRWVRMVRLLSLFVFVLISTGCFGQADAGPTEPEILETLPEDWLPVEIEKVGIWHPIDIDDDPNQSEFLIFFTYNNVVTSEQEPTNNGPSGTLIFDLQNNSEFMPAANVLAMPYQPSGSYIPYRPLPNYWEGSGDGFVAPSGRHNNLTLNVATRTQDAQTRVVIPPPSGESDTAEPTPEKIKELLIRDGGKTVTVVWWRDIFKGYGAASVHAAAGVKKLEFETKDEPSTPLLRFDGYHPFHDRSELCNVIHYEREYLTTTLSSNVSGVWLNSDVPVDVQFDETQIGIDFCKSVGPVPFYPEGVVLKYLTTDKPDERLTDFLGGVLEQTAKELRAAVQRSSNESNDGEEITRLRISGIFGPQVIPFQNRQVSRATVCVEFIDITASADVPESTKRSAATFRLRHEKPDINYPSTDEFRIEGAELIPSPENEDVSPVDCNAFVEDGTPGRVGGP